MQHTEIWRALDALAARHRLTASGLARAAGLDPTTFNKSKRVSADGRPRWPSSESVTRALEAVGATYADFAALVGAGARGGGAVPIVPLTAEAATTFDARGRPIDVNDTIRFPSQGLSEVFACELVDDSGEPVFRAGDILIVQPSADLRRGDRVVVRLRAGGFLVRRLGGRTDQAVELAPLDPRAPTERLPLADAEWIARIVWASQ